MVILPGLPAWPMPARVADGLEMPMVNVGLYMVVDGVDVPESTPGSTSDKSSAISGTLMCKRQAHSLMWSLKFAE